MNVLDAVYLLGRLMFPWGVLVVALSWWAIIAAGARMGGRA